MTVSPTNETGLILLTCRASPPTNMLAHNTAFALVENLDYRPILGKRKTYYIARSAERKLDCSHKTPDFLLWKHLLNKTSVHVGYGILIGDKYLKTFDNKYQLDDKGVLTLYNIQVEQEGTYTCISSEGNSSDLFEHVITVYRKYFLFNISSRSKVTTDLHKVNNCVAFEIFCIHNI